MKIHLNILRVRGGKYECISFIKVDPLKLFEFAKYITMHVVAWKHFPRS